MSRRLTWWGIFSLLFTVKIRDEEVEILEFLAILTIFYDCFGELIFSHVKGNVLLKETKVFLSVKNSNFFARNLAQCDIRF